MVLEKAGRERAGRIAYGWVLLSVLSLVFAGIFAFMVALARTPFIEDLLPLGRDYIYVALVGHVVLAVVIWFLAFEGFLLAYAATVHINRQTWSPLLAWCGLGAAGTGMALVVAASIFGLGTAELANYVPVLLTPVFYAGLALFASGVLLNIINSSGGVVAARKEGLRLPMLTIGMVASGLATVVAFSCFVLSGYFQAATGKVFIDFERLFWGGGHILQFANTIAMVTVWVFLAALVLKAEPLRPAAAKALYGVYGLFIAPAPLIYFFHDTATQAYKDSFTALMQWGLGPPTAVFMLAVFIVAARGERPWRSPGFSSLILSIFIFAVGGLIALDIGGVNTKIPAHYHCVIGAVTIAFMGLFYEMVPMLGRRLHSVRLAALQPYLYSAGILLFAAGLYLAGSHGVARKTYGGEQNLNNLGKIIGMSVMGLGGLVAIAGGITFVWNALFSLIGSRGESSGGRL